jgi:hypothetical protein
MIKINNFFSSVLLTIIFMYSTCATAFEEVKDPLEEVALAELKYQRETFESGAKDLIMQNEFKKANIVHQKNLMIVTEESFELQYWMTLGIFIIVSLLVTGGFYLSYLQFKSDSESSAESKGATFKIGKTGIEFSSSVIGLVVLFMSFMFFYLYVKDVYTIQIHKVPAATTNTTIPQSPTSKAN